MLYAVGKPGGPVRQFYDAGIFEMRAQVRDGEVAVPAERRGAARISADGVLLTDRTPVSLPDIITAVQLTTPIAVPAGATWTAKGQDLTGPQDISFAAAGGYTVKMTDQWIGIGMVTVLSAADYQAWLIEQVKGEAERRQMLALSPGGAKKMVYPAKQAEVEAYYSLGGTLAAITLAFNGLTTETKARRFRYAMREAAISGDPIATVMARFKAGADAAQDEVARIEAIAQIGKRSIRLATSGAARRDTFARINWAAT